MNTEEHRPTDACAEFHCAWHNVDEPDVGWMVCGECLHTFVTEADYTDEHRKRQVRDYGRELEITLDGSSHRVFCPLCSHDL